MSYLTIEDETKKHLLHLIDWIFKEVKSSSGDGDALWYSRYYSIQDLFSLVTEYNNSLNLKWKVSLNEHTELLSWGDNQECVLITNNEEFYLSAPKWQQCIIVN